MDTHIRPPKLMDRVKATMRVKRYSPRTEKTYCYWIRYFIRFHGMRHPSTWGVRGTRLSGAPCGRTPCVSRHVEPGEEAGVWNIESFRHATARGCCSPAPFMAFTGRPHASIAMRTRFEAYDFN
ncbi:site-specific integrase [Halomonas lactosivorans]|uniref:site-specific integrase n=1 Tax=Billgrantia lactosivorans TaxID=2185141 RepID=UPI001C5557E8